MDKAKALQEEVQQETQEVREVGTKAKAEHNQTYTAGSLAEYTGKVETIFGGVFYEVLMLEGPDKGELRLVAWSPDDPKAQFTPGAGEET